MPVRFDTPGYRVSQVIRTVGWLKAAAGLRQTKHRGRARVGWDFMFGMATYDLVRMANLMEKPALGPKPGGARSEWGAKPAGQTIIGPPNSPQ